VSARRASAGICQPSAHAAQCLLIDALACYDVFTRSAEQGPDVRFFQIVGWAFLLLTAMLGVYEMVQHMRNGSSTLTDVGQFWAQMNPRGLSATQSFVQSIVGADVWNWFLRLPIMAVTAFIGIVLLFIDYTIPRRSHYT
jgi:hypothetical protein